MTIHPARNPKTERWLDELGVTWTFDPDVILAKVDRDASLANQVRHVPLDEGTVDRYAADMAHGDTFPAVLIDADTMALLGGNHRDAAHRRANHTTMPGYLVSGDTTTLLRVRVEDNRNHGLPTTTEERLDHGLALVDAGLTQKEAARIVGLPQPKLSIHAGVTHLAGRIAAHPKADRAARLPKATRYQLSQITDDAVLHAAVDLVVDAALPTKDVKALVESTKAVDELEAMRIIGQLTEDNAERITDQAGNLRRSSRTARAMLDQALAVIAGLDPVDVYDTCPNDDVRAVLAQRIMNAAGKLAPTHDLLTGKTPRAKGRAA